MMFAIIESDRIARILSGDITKFPGAVKLPDDFRGTVGMNQGEFNDDWTIKPTPERVAGGYLKVPKGYKLDGEQFVELTQAERYQQGVDPIPDGMILDGDDIRPMTRVELVATGKLTQDDADILTAADVREDRDRRMRNIVDTYNAIRWEGMTESEQQEIRDFRQALLNVPQQLGFPYNVVWPKIPITYKK